MSQESNTIGKDFPCEQCGKSFRSRISLKRHKLIHPTDKPFECDQCSYKGPYDYSLKYHKLLVHEYKSKISINKPRNNNVVFVNPNSPSTSASTSQPNTSAQVHSEPDLDSDEGPKPTVAAPDLKPPLKCKWCNSWFTTKANLENHESKHSAESKVLPMYQCRNCLSWPVFKTQEELDSHVLSHHARQDNKNFECDVCDYKGKNVAGLKSHKSFVHDYKSKIVVKRLTPANNIVFIRPVAQKPVINQDEDVKID